MNPRPLGMRKTIRLLIALTILAWATQTLIHQWGFGAEIPALGQDPNGPEAADEKFVPPASRTGPAAAVELRSEARINGPEVRLKQICRWSKADAPAFVQIGELVIARFEETTPFKTVTLAEIRQTLHDAGVNVAVINFHGTTQCTVSRSDVQYDQTTALDQWIAARAPTTAPSEVTPASQPTQVASASTPHEDAAPVHTLRELLIGDLSVRLSMPVDQLQVNFNPADQKLLNLAEPEFKFNINGETVRNLGDVSWDVLVVTESGNRKASISANARAWQNQIALIKPVVYGQVFQAADVTDRRVLVDRVADETLLTKLQIVGQQASRDLQAGTVLTARLVEAVPLARQGQFITVTLNQGSVRVKTVARAMENGSYGQTIKVKNESNEEVYQVVLTGPQEGTMGPIGTAPQARLDDK